MVHIVDPRQDVTFWEAFPVAAGATESTADVFQSPPQGDSGTTTVTALVQHRNFGGRDPRGMRKGDADLADDYGFSSNQAPPFWVAGAGAQHNLTFTWDDDVDADRAVINTVPATGAPTFKENYKDLDAG